MSFHDAFGHVHLLTVHRVDSQVLRKMRDVRHKEQFSSEGCGHHVFGLLYFPTTMLPQTMVSDDDVNLQRSCFACLYNVNDEIFNRLGAKGIA